MVAEREPEKCVPEITDDTVRLALDIGEQILVCGGEIGRVEDTITRVCNAYGAARTDVFAIISLIIVTVTDADGKSFTLSRRIFGIRKNMRRLEQINALSRRICAESLPIGQAQQLLKGIMDERQKVVWRVTGSLLVGFFFTAFFGGNLRDCLTAIVVSGVIVGTQILIDRLAFNHIFSQLVCSFFAGTVAILSVKAGLGSSVDAIMSGCIMLLIPGLSMTNAVENLIVGDTLSGLLGFFEAILIALVLAAGFAISMFIIGGLL